MNKATPLLTLFALALTSHSSLAAKSIPVEFAEARLRYETALHERTERILLMTDQGVYVDGIKLSTVERIVKRDFIVRALAAEKSGIKGRCAAGIFSHSVKIRGKIAVENGCLDSPRFAEVLFSLNQLRPSFTDPAQP